MKHSFYREDDSWIRSWTGDRRDMASIVDASHGKEAEEADEERVGKKSEILWSQIVEWKYAVFRIIYSHIPTQ